MRFAIRELHLSLYPCTASGNPFGFSSQILHHFWATLIYGVWKTAPTAKRKRFFEGKRFYKLCQQRFFERLVKKLAVANFGMKAFYYAQTSPLAVPMYSFGTSCGPPFVRSAPFLSHLDLRWLKNGTMQATVLLCSDIKFNEKIPKFITKFT